MKLELEGAKVSLILNGDEVVLVVNGQKIPSTREVAIQLLFGKRMGCQSPASRKKLSESLKKYHETGKKKHERLSRKPVAKPAPKPNGKLNGFGHHVN